MKKAIIYTIVGTIMSFYLFPIGLTFLPPSINTKMILAVLGAGLYVLNGISRNKLAISQTFLGSLFFALLFSLACYFSVTLTNTGDYIYATYFTSFFTWMAGAYAVCYCIKYVHGDVSLRLISAYAIGVGVFQGVSAILIDEIPAVQRFVDMFMEIGQAHVRELGRLYGVGAALDPAGVRFTIIQILLAHQLCTNEIVKESKSINTTYIIALCLIVVLGNMISRTTTIGTALSLGYLLVYRFWISEAEVSQNQLSFIMIFVAIIGLISFVTTLLYNTNVDFHDNMRFAFEGFFNWIETGEWRTDSTDKLNGEMWIWPTDTRSWIIGTGLFSNFVYSTDVGYCRFILYCGLIGFSIFSMFFVYNSWAVTQLYKNARFLALLLTAVVFIIWIKVATDIFFIYAILFSAYALRAEESEDNMEEEIVVEDEE